MCLEQVDAEVYELGAFEENREVTDHCLDMMLEDSM